MYILTHTIHCKHTCGKQDEFHDDDGGDYDGDGDVVDV